MSRVGAEFVTAARCPSTPAVVWKSGEKKGKGLLNPGVGEWRVMRKRRKGGEEEEEVIS